MITIDGSYGEGGGQILRSAIALSILKNNPVMIDHIRANRPQPGLKPQHYTVLSLLKLLSSADTEGLRIGSSEVRFFPNKLKEGSYRIDLS